MISSNNKKTPDWLKNNSFQLCTNDKYTAIAYFISSSMILSKFYDKWHKLRDKISSVASELYYMLATLHLVTIGNFDPKKVYSWPEIFNHVAVIGRVCRCLHTVRCGT